MHLTFHRSHSEVVTVSELDRVAQKLSFHRVAAVFSSRPVKPDELVFFRCHRNTPVEHRKTAVGFTHYDPSKLSYDTFLREFAALPKGRIVFVNTVDANKKPGDDHCIHYDDQGTIYYGVNGMLDTTLDVTRKDGNLWMYFVMGSISELELISNPLSDRVLDRYLKTSRRLKIGYKSVISAIHDNKPGLISKIPKNNERMLFHKNCLNFATLDGRQAGEPLDVKVNVAFSSKPITIGECLSFTVESAGSVRLGLLVHDPAKFSQNDLTKKFPENHFGPEGCDFLAVVKFETGDLIHVALIQPDGSLPTALVGKNGEYLLSKKLTGSNFWVVFRCVNVVKLVVVDFKEMEAEEVTKTIIPNPAAFAEQQIYHFENDLNKGRAPLAKPEANNNLDSPLDGSPDDSQATIVPANKPRKPDALNVKKDPAVHHVPIRKVSPAPKLSPAPPKKTPPLIPTTPLKLSGSSGTSSDHGAYQVAHTTIFDKLYLKELTMIKSLGSGAQGEVKMVSCPLLGRKAAKIFTHSSVVMSKYERREIETLAKLTSHPFIISIHGFIYDNENSPEPMGFLMELMDNGSMYNVIHDVVLKGGDRKFRVRIEKPHLYNWIQQAASAFNFMHSAGVLHRDIKTLNMLLTNDHEQLRICDLGLSGEVRIDMTFRIGTYFYMAPEVLAYAGDGRVDNHYDSKCDVYSLGICMWEMWHRRIPYSHVNEAHHIFVKKVCREGLRPIIKSELGGGTLPELIKRCWAPKPEDRPTMFEICRIAHGKLVELEKSGYDLRIRSAELP